MSISLLCQRMRTILLSLFLLASCSQEGHKVANSSRQEICGREGSPTYRADVPAQWVRKEIPDNKSDTTKALCEFWIGDSIRITLHNFPSETIEARVPPAAQIARWQRQFQELDPQGLNITPFATGGFAGYHLEATGMVNGEPETLLGWAMQLAPEHFRVLVIADESSDRRSDYTIKAVGPADLMRTHKQEIVRFAKSFELIDEIQNTP